MKLTLAPQIITIYLICAIFGAGQVFAQPTVTVTAEPINDFHSVLFTFVQDDLASMDGCHYNFFAADKASDLKSVPGRGRSIATFFKPLNTIQIIAGPLPHITRSLEKGHARSQAYVKVYFKTLLSCPLAVNGQGDLIYFAMKTYKIGKLTSNNKLTKSMKNHMRY